MVMMVVETVAPLEFGQYSIKDGMEEYEPELRLWRAVLDRVVSDIVENHSAASRIKEKLAKIKKGDLSRRQETELLVLEAAKQRGINYLRARRTPAEDHNNEEPGLFFVCDMADIPPAEVRKQANKILAPYGIEI